MDKIKYTIPLLALILLIPAGMGNGFAQEVPGGEELEANGVGPVGNVGAYLDVLHQQEEYQYMSTEEQEIYNINAIDFMVSENNYEEQRNILLQKLSIITLETQSTEDEETLEKLHLEYDYVLNHLEYMGVTTYAKYQENPEYFSEKYQSSFDEFNDAEQPTLVIEVDFRYIHTDDISLKNKATIYFPCFPGYAEPIRCPVSSFSFGPGTTSTSVWFIPHNGDLTFESGSCLVNEVSHSRVYFNINSDESATHVTGTEFYNNQDSANTSLRGYPDGVCRLLINTIDTFAADRADLSSTLGMTVTVRGTHA